MVTTYLVLLSAIVFLPAVAAVLVLCVPKENVEASRRLTFGATVVVLALTILTFLTPLGGPFDYQTEAAAGMQYVFSVPWIPSFHIAYFMGADGISMPLVMLTAVICVLAAGASWSVTTHVKAYCVLFLLLETGMLGVFLALDFFLFYVFWEVVLLPMYFLIGVWGGPRREYAAIKFFLYTLAGSVLMLIAILMLYFASDLTDPALRPFLGKCYLPEAVQAQAEAGMTARAAGQTVAPLHTFNLLALAQIGQQTQQLGENLQWWAFLLLFIGFVIKLPSVPVHTWLPDAHVEAPTPISMILAAILLKMGGYGILRICYPICPHGGYDLALFVCVLGVVSMVYGAFAALAQKDFKRLVAYSSVSHMGYVVLGLGVWSATAGTAFNTDYWNMGVQGAMFQMIGHGISSAGMFFLVGVVYDRVHHRELDAFGGLFGRMPVYTALSIGIFFASLGLPGLCGFIGEILVVLSVWNYSYALAVISATVMILTAAYILWMIQRVYLGGEYKGPHGDALTPTTLRENAIGGVLFALTILFGVFPNTFLLRYVDKTVTRQVNDLAQWTRLVKEPAQQASVDGQAALEARVNVDLAKAQTP